MLLAALAQRKHSKAYYNNQNPSTFVNENSVHTIIMYIIQVKKIEEILEQLSVSTMTTILIFLDHIGNVNDTQWFKGVDQRNDQQM